MTRQALTPTGAYVATVAVVGAIVVGYSAGSLPHVPYFAEWCALSMLAMLASRFPLRVPGTNAWFSISDTFFITSALLFGPAPATVTMAIDSVVMSYGVSTRLRRYVFNGTAPAIAFWTGAQVFFALSGVAPLYGHAVSADALVLPLSCFTAVYFVLNSGLTAAAIALEKRTSPAAVIRSHFGVVSLNWFAAASAAFLLVLLAQYLSVLAVAAVIPLIATIHLAMRSWTGRIEDAEKHVATVDRLYLSTIGALSTAIEAKDGVTSSHIHRVQHYAMGLAKALGTLDEQSLRALQAAALLHDTGKLAVPERILNKPGKLTAAEFETMKLHVNVGADILSAIDFPYPVVPIVRAHHENWDGSGYPNGLKGVEIPIGARILSVVDCYDALTSDRPYRGAMSDEEAFAILQARRGSMYDPEIVDLFAEVCRDIGPLTVKPQLQRAIDSITRTVASAQADAPLTAPPSALAPDTFGSLSALANLARIVSGTPTAADVSSLVWSQVKHVAPAASCAFFLHDVAADSLRASFVAGPGSALLQGLEIAMGERLSGWVADQRQAIVNSEANLDLGGEAALAGLRYCLSLPLVAQQQLAGVLSLYASEPFNDEQAQTLQFVASHVAQMLRALERGGEVPSQRSALRIVASR